MPDTAAKITAGELVLVCSRYDLGAIRALQRFKGGSRESPKVLVISDRGRFLIKRRAPRAGVSGDDLAHRVALSHEVQLHLASRGFPVAGLMGTREGNNSLLELHGNIYEVFCFVQGVRYDHSPGAAFAAGQLLTLLHRLLLEIKPTWTPPGSTFHANPAVAPSIERLAAREPDARLRDDLMHLRDAYRRAGEWIDARGGALGPPAQLIHADWHPGNLLFADPGARPGPRPEVAAVLDFDSVRLGQPILDLANGAMQFAVSRRTGRPGPDGHAGIRMSMSPDLLRAFLDGSRHENGGRRLRPEEVAVFPWLMIEALVVETVAPIAATGRFGKVGAGAAVAMTRQAVEWMAADADRLVSLAAGH